MSLPRATRSDLLPVSELKARGWTNALIRTHLGAPDRTRPHPHYRLAPPIRLYLTARVEAVEASDAWATAQETRRRQKGGARLTGQTTQQHLQAYLDRLPITITVWSRDVLIQKACQHYNRRQAERHWEDGREATPDADPAFLARILVHYLRQSVSRYEEELKQVFGTRGVREADAAIQQKVYGAIQAAYPALATECARQLQEKLAQSEGSTGGRP